MGGVLACRITVFWGPVRASFLRGIHATAKVGLKPRRGGCWLADHCVLLSCVVRPCVFQRWLPAVGPALPACRLAHTHGAVCLSQPGLPIYIRAVSSLKSFHCAGRGAMYALAHLHVSASTCLCSSAAQLWYRSCGGSCMGFEV